MLALAMIGGQVFDERGFPVRRALVGGSSPQDRAVTHTNAQGQFTLGIIAREPVRILARKLGYTVGICGKVVPWTFDLKIVLVRTGSLSGRIIADPMPRTFELQLFKREGPQSIPVKTCSLLRRPEGLFSITRLHPGTYELRVQADGYETQDPIAVHLGPGENIDRLELRLRPR